MRKIKLGYIGEIKNFKGNNKELLNMFDLDDYKVCEDIDLMQSHQKIQSDRHIFLVFEKGNTRELYKLLPLVEDDNIFHWKEWGYRKNVPQHLISKVGYGLLNFSCNYYTADGSVIINPYIRTRMGCQLAPIRLNDGDYGNKEILDAIEKYVEDFKQEANMMKLQA